MLLGAVASMLALACNPEARNEASVPCEHDRECNSALTCLPTKNGVTGACLVPACSKTCATDDDCKGLRSSQQGDECFVCQDVGACPRAVRVDDAGPLKACVDRCVAQ